MQWIPLDSAGGDIVEPIVVGVYYMLSSQHEPVDSCEYDSLPVIIMKDIKNTEYV